MRPRGEDDAFTILLDPIADAGRTSAGSRRRRSRRASRSAIEYYREHGIEQTYTHLKVAE